MNGLPKGWVTCALRECVNVLDNMRVPVNSDERAKRLGDIPYYGATGQVGWIDDFLFDEELLLIGEDGAPFFDKSKPISYIIRGKSWVNNHAHVLRAKPAITSNLYLKWYLDWFDFHDSVNGTTRLKLTQSAMNEIQVLLPPLYEQRRIVAKLEELLDMVAACEKRLAKMPVILKRFRQAVLAAACSGRLTADWREEHTLPLAPSHQGNGKKKETAAASQSHSPLVGEGRGEGEVMPEGWRAYALREIADEIRTGPFGSALHKTDYIDDGIPVINPMHIQDGRIMPSREMAVSKETYERLSGYSLKEGDIILARRGEMGRCAVVTEKENGWLCGTGSAILRLKNFACPWFMQLLISSPTTRQYLSDGSVGTTMDNLNQQLFAALPVSLPPLPEQQEIVRRVEALFTLADQLEARYRKANEHVVRLTQSILAKAFRGELVQQDENDEPASVLPERTRAQRPETSPAKRPVVPIRPKKQKLLPEPEPLPLAAEPLVIYAATIPQRILAAMETGKEYTRADITVEAGLSDAEWTWSIRQLKDEEKVRQIGERRGARYLKI